MQHPVSPFPLLLFVSILALPTPAQEPVRPEPPPIEEEEGASDRQLRQEAERAAERMDTVIVTATRRAARLFDLPYRAESVGDYDLTQGRMLPDALKERPGVMVQRTSYGQASPYLRGLTGYHTLLLIDGIRTNNSIWRSGPNEYWGTVDPLSLERFELVLGPGSVLHGSDAVGGTVNAIPRRRFPSGESSWDRRVYVRYSSAENSISGRAEVSGNVGDSLGFVLGISGASYGELKAGGAVGRQERTDYHTWFGDARFEIPLDERWTLGVLAQTAFIEDISRTHRTIYGVSYRGTEVGTDLRHDLDWNRQLGALFITGDDLEGFAERIEIRLSFQRLEERLDRIRSNETREKSGFDVDTFGIGIQLTSQTRIGRLTYGFDWYHDEVDSVRRNFDSQGAFMGSGVQGPVGDDARYDLLGFYIQDEIRLGDAWGLTVGGRITYARAEADAVEDLLNPGNRLSMKDDWTDVVGLARLIWRPHQGVRLWGGVSQAFRAPNLSDLTRFDIARSNELELPAPGLDPERFISFDLGAKARFGGFKGEVGYYFTLIDDLIIRRPTAMMSGTNTLVSKDNAGDGHVQGIELRARYDFDAHWSVLGSFAWTDGRIDAYPSAAQVLREEPLTRLAPIQGTIAVRWQTEDGRFWMQPSAVFVDAQDRLSSSDNRDSQRIPPGGTPGYTLFHLHAGFNIDEKSFIFAGIENIGDKNYRVHGSGTQEPGINFIAGVDLTF